MNGSLAQTLSPYTHALDRVWNTLAMQSPQGIVLTGLVWVGAGVVLRYERTNNVPVLVNVAAICLAWYALQLADSVAALRKREQGDGEETEGLSSEMQSAIRSLDVFISRLTVLSHRVRRGIQARRPLTIGLVALVCAVLIVLVKTVSLPVLLLPVVSVVLATPAVCAHGMHKVLGRLKDRVVVGLLRRFVSTYEWVEKEREGDTGSGAEE